MDLLKPLRSKLVIVVMLIILFFTIMEPLNFFVENSSASLSSDVTIANFAFNPQNVTISVGSTLTWLNNDPVIYTLWFVYAGNETTYEKVGNEGLSDPIPPGDSWSWTFNEPVVLHYYSFERLWITGYIIVQAEIHDIALVNVKPWKTIVGEGYTCKVNVTITNEGNFTETFNATLYANMTVVNTYTDITLLGGNSTILTFIWNTTGWAKGNYTLRAYAWPVLGETDTADNTFTDGTVWIRWPYDVTGDGYCGIDDIVAVAEHFGTMPGDPNWNMIYDINGDNYVGIDDIVAVAEHFGETDP